MSVVDQQLSTKPIPAEPETIATALNREIVPVLRRIRAYLNQLVIPAPANTMFAQTFGDGVATVFDIAHPFGTNDVMVSVYDPATGQDAAMSAPVQRLGGITVRLTFGAPPSPNRRRVLVWA